MEKEWLDKKDELKKGVTFSTVEQHAFILYAVNYKDLEGISLAIKHNFDLKINNDEGDSFWFHLAKKVLYEEHQEFTIQTLALLAQFGGPIIYSREGSKDLLAAAICKNNIYKDYFTNCNFDHKLGKIFYHRYLSDLQAFKFEGDIRILVILAINLYCDYDAIQLSRLHGLRFEEILCEGDNIAHVIARATQKYHKILKEYPDDILSNFYLKNCLNLKEFIESPLVYQTNKYQKFPENLTDNPDFIQMVKQYKSDNTIDKLVFPKDEIREQLPEIRNVLPIMQNEINIGELEKFLIIKDQEQDMKLMELEEKTINGIKDEEIPNMEEVKNLEEYLNSAFFEHLYSYNSEDSKSADVSSDKAYL